MQATLVEEWIYALVRELNQHKGKVAVGFAAVTALVVAVGLAWPQTFESSAIVFADEQNIIRPLLAGQAEVTRPSDANQLEVVRQRVKSTAILEQVAREAGFADKNPRTEVPAAVLASLSQSIIVSEAGARRFKIAFRDGDPNRAYTVASELATAFISDSARTKREESGEAYTFIDTQVKTYKDQLQAAEDRLKDFKSANPGSSGEAITNRLSELRSRIESLSLDLRVARARRDELRNQLSRESQFIAQSYKADVYRSAMSDAQSRLDTLRLSYQENYPDIVALKQQIEDLRQSIARAESEPAPADRGGTANPVHQRLRSELTDAEVAVKTLQLQLDSAQRLLDSEIGNSKQSAEYEARLAELNRDYSVTKGIYEDLLERKERARMSVALDVQGQGLNYKIQEPPAYPNAPVGLRFTHFFLIAPFLGMLAPIGLIVAYIMFDPRMRFVDRVQEALPQPVPILISIPHMSNSSGLRQLKSEWGMVGILFAVVIVVYVIVALLRLSGVL